MWYDKAKSIGAMAGIVISVFLIGQQLGIFIFLTDAMGYIVQNNQGYIWVVDEETKDVNALANLDVRVGYEMASVPGVDKVYPIVITVGAAKFANGKSSSVQLIGVQTPAFAGGPWNLELGKPQDLQQDGAVTVDFFDRPTLGEIAPGEYFEVNGQQVFVAGQTRGVRGFGAGPVVFSTIERVRKLTSLSSDKSSAFLVTWDPKVATEAEVVDRINATIPGIRAWNAKEFTSQTVSTVLASSGIAFSIGTLVVFALISGIIIIGLTLYSAAIDRIRDYGTLKAIGSTNGYLTRLIMLQATLFGLIGFVLGYGLVEAFRNGVAQAGTIFNFPPVLIVSLFVATQVISLGGSLFAILRITRLEPAMVFRG